LFLKLIRRLGKNDRGASMVEFAIVAMLLFALIFGIIEFGWIFNGYITLTSAAQEGARLAIVMKDFDQAAVEQKVKDHAKIFKEGNLQITVDPPLPTYGEETKVQVIGDLELLIGFPPLPNSISISTSATMRQEQ